MTAAQARRQQSLLSKLPLWLPPILQPPLTRAIEARLQESASTAHWVEPRQSDLQSKPALGQRWIAWQTYAHDDSLRGDFVRAEHTTAEIPFTLLLLAQGPHGARHGGLSLVVPRG